MFGLIAALVIIGLTLVLMSLRKTYFYIPATELKRQAKTGDNLAKTLYRAVAYGPSLGLLLWLLIGLSVAAGFVLVARVVPPQFSFAGLAVLFWVTFAWLPNTRVTAFDARLALWLTPILAWLLNYLYPIFSRLTDWWQRHYPAQTHNGLYERDDLLELFKRQRNQSDSRITASEIDLVERALNFSQHKVRDIVVSRKQVKAVAANDAVGPILLDELHASGHKLFPVYKSSPDKITGILHLITLDEAKQGGKVSDFMEQAVNYLHENDSLDEMMAAVYRTKHQLFVVINSFDEYVGIVTLEDALHQLIGQPIKDQYDSNHSRSAALNRHPVKSKRTKVADAVAKKPTEVVE